MSTPSTLNIVTHVLAYNDPTATNNPKRRPIEWESRLLNVPVKNPKTDLLTVDPSQVLVAFDGSRSSTVGASTEFSLTLLPTGSTTYRINWTGGQDPGFRTNRNIVVAAQTLTVVVNANNTITVTGANFTGVVPGDIVWIPSTTTGDPASPFNALNVGEWLVLASTTAAVTLVRKPGEVFSGYGEVVPVTDNAQFQIFSAAGIQAGDIVDVSSGFAPATQRMFEITFVTPSYIQFESTLPLPPETDIQPGATGITFYDVAKRFVQVEVDQQCILHINGDQGRGIPVVPVLPGDEEHTGMFRLWGSIWKLTITNLSSVPATATVLSAE